MMKGLIKSLAFFTIFMLFSFSVVQASSYSEVGDAGSLPASAQSVTGTGIISEIYGTLSFNDVDMFKIYIYDPSNFYASTINGDTTVDDTQLFLFDENGYGVLANDDYSDTCWKSYLSSFEGEPGIYFLAISSWDRDPVSDGGLIFPTYPYDQIYGPTGPGGDQPITGWTNVGLGSGSYRIVLGGVAAVPVPASVILLGSGLIGFLGLRRVRLEL